MKLQQYNGADMIKSHVDQVGSTINGWAVDFDSPALRCAIDIFVSGSRVGTFFTGSQERSDVADAFENSIDVRHGFSIDISPFLGPEPQTVEVRLNKTGESISVFEASFAEYGIGRVNGLDGFLFYNNDSNSTLSQLQGELMNTEEQLDPICVSLAAAHGFCDLGGSGYATTIIPDRAAAIEPMVGNGFELAAKRPATQLVSFAAEKYGLPIDYALDAVRSLGAPTAIAARYETHLSHPAYFECVRSMALAQFPERFERHVSGLSWSECERYGDLSNIFKLNIGESMAVPVYDPTPIMLFNTADLRAKLTGSVNIRINEGIDDGIAVVFGTSSSTVIAEFLAMFFRMTVSCWGNFFDGNLIKRLKPTFVCNTISEKTILQMSLSHKPVLDLNRILAAREIYFPEG